MICGYPIRGALSGPVLLGLGLLVAACGGGGGGGNDGPPVFTVRADEGCAGVCEDIVARLDDRTIGTLNAGEALKIETTVGDHVFEAEAEGCHWAPKVEEVPEGGFVETLFCEVTGPTMLTVKVNADCAGICSNVGITVDGESQGILQPGEGEVMLEVEPGMHTIEGLSLDGCGWGPYKQEIGQLGFIQDLCCGCN